MRILFCAVVAFFFLPALFGQGELEVKEGLWSVHTQMTENPGNEKTEGTYMLCRDHAYDKAVLEKAKNMKGCTVNLSHQGNKYISEQKCTVSGSTITSTGTTTYQADTAFHSESRAKNDPPLYGKSESTVIIDQKYVGSCPAGAKPGDRFDQNGKPLRPART